jgi:hypothetical protein
MMCLTSTFATSNKQSLDLKDVLHSNAVRRGFITTAEGREFDPFNTDSIKVLKEERSRDKKYTLLDLVKWAQEQQWKGSPDLSTNHDAYFYEAVKEDLEADDDDDDDDDEVLEAERPASE